MQVSLSSTLTPAQQEALAMLRSASRVLLTGHVRPDGDCVGAQAALARILEKLGKSVVVLNPDAAEPQYEYLTSSKVFQRFDGVRVPEHDLTVLLDCSELSRCGELGKLLGQHPSKKLVIDHHIHEDAQWWDASFRDLKCAATGLLVWRIARALGVGIDESAARGIFTSLVTDTGWFKYSNTDVESFQVASELVQSGLDPSELYRAIYQRKPSEQPRQIGAALRSLEYYAEGRLAVIDMPLDERGRAQELEGDDLLDLARAVNTVEVVILVRALPGQKCKASLRSKTSYDVNRLARRFGGGGHAKAAGVSMDGDLTDVRARLIAAAIEGFCAH